MIIFSFPYHLNFLFSTSGIRTRAETYVLEAGIIPKKETVLNLSVRIPKDLTKQVVSMPLMAKLGLTVSAAILPSGKNCPSYT